MLTYIDIKTGQTMVVNHVTGETLTLAEYTKRMMDDSVTELIARATRR